MQVYMHTLMNAKMSKGVDKKLNNENINNKLIFLLEYGLIFMEKQKYHATRTFLKHFYYLIRSIINMINVY